MIFTVLGDFRNPQKQLAALGELWEALGEPWGALTELWEALGELWGKVRGKYLKNTYKSKNKKVTIGP